MIASNWALQVAAGAYLISHVRIYMTYMMHSSGEREVCMRQEFWNSMVS